MKQSGRLNICRQIAIRPSPYRRNQSQPAAYGAEVLRLWAALSDYRKDVAVGDEVLTKTRESLRKLRNVFRFMLSNLYDFDEARRYITAIARYVTRAEPNHDDRGCRHTSQARHALPLHELRQSDRYMHHALFEFAAEVTR